MSALNKSGIISNVLISLILISNSIVISQTNGGYDVNFKKYKYTCQYCKKTVTEYSIVNFSKVGNHKDLDCIYFVEFNKLFDTPSLQLFTNGSSECSSNLNRTLRHVVVDKPNVSYETSHRDFVLGNNCMKDYSSYESLIKEFPQFETCFDSNTLQKFKDHRTKLINQQILLIKDFKNNVDSLSSIHNYVQITNEFNILVKKIESNKESVTKELQDYILLLFSDYMNECLNNNDFTSYDSNLNNFKLYYQYGDGGEWERKRYTKERDFLISLINLPLSAGDEIYCGKWVLTSRFQENEYTMKIELNKDHTFSYSNTALSENYKGYWNIYHPKMELQLVITEYFNSYNNGWLEYDPRKSIVPKVYSIEPNKKQNLNLYYSLKQSGGNDVTLFYKGRKIE